MVALLLALLSGGIIFLIVNFIFSWVEAIAPGIVFFLTSYFFISRAIGRKMQVAMLRVQKELQSNRIEAALQGLEELKKQFGRWQFFTASTIDGQIGSIYFMRHDFVKALPYLERAFVRHWVARAMLGVLQYKKRNYVAMNKTFEKAARYSSGQGLLWSVWAFCLSKAGDNDKAIEVLQQGKAKLGDKDPRIAQNLNNLQNRKRMKMKSYGEQWYQFQMELSPQMQQVKGGGVRFGRQ